MNRNAFKPLSMTVLFLLTIPYLFAGGGGGGGESFKPELWGHIKNGDANVCLGELLTMELVTTLPNPQVVRWEIQYSGSENSHYLIDDETGKAWTEKTAVLKSDEEVSVLIRILYTSSNYEYYTTIHALTYHKNVTKPGTISSNQSVVSTSAPSELLGTDASSSNERDGKMTYEWQKSIDQYSWESINGATNKNYQPPVMSTSSYYRRIAKNSSGYCSANSNVINVEVVKASISGTDGESCLNSRGNFFNIVAVGSKSPTIQWQKNKNSGVWTDVPGATGNQFTPVESVDGTYKYRAKASWESGTQTMFTEEREVTYYPLLQSGSISPLHQTIVGGTLPEEIKGTLPSGGNGNYTYQWQKGSSATTWDDIKDATTQNYQVPVNSDGTYRRVVNAGNGCVAVSNSVVIKLENLNAGTIGHNATIGKHGRHRPLVSTSPTNGQEFRWELQTSANGVDYGAWTETQTWSSEQGFTPTVTLSENYNRYRRLTRIVSGGNELPSNYVTIRVSDVDPGAILISPDRTTLVQYDTLGMLQQDPAFLSSHGVEKRFKWQMDNPDANGMPQGGWVNLMDWGDSISSKNYRYNTPFSDPGLYVYRRRFVQDSSNQNRPSLIFESNEATVYVEALHGGTIAINDTMVMRDAIPNPLTTKIDGNGKYYKWQWRNPQTDAEGVWTDLTNWVQNGVGYTPTDNMKTPQREYRRLCKTLQTTPDNLAKSSNVIRVYARSIEPGVISIDPESVVKGGRVNLSSIEPGTGVVFKWQVQRQLGSGTWGNWESLGTNIFAADKIGSLEENVRVASKYRRLAKTSVGESEVWIAYSNEVSVTVIALSGGKIARNQDIVRNGIPAKFTNEASGNGEVYAWYRKKEGEALFSAITTFGGSLEYQEETPVEVKTYYRRLVKPTATSVDGDTIGSNTIVITPSQTLLPGKIAISSTGIKDTTINQGGRVSEFYSVDNGNGTTFRWQKQTEGTEWNNVTEWGHFLTFHSIMPLEKNAIYRRATKAAMANPDNLIQYSDTITVNINNMNAGKIAGDTTFTKRGIPNLFKNIRSGEGTLYKWQKKVGAAAWTDITGWTADNLEYKEKDSIKVTTYYRRLNKTEADDNNRAVSSNTITVTIENLETRDETVSAENFYLRLEEIGSQISDEMLILRSRATAIDNLSSMPIPIKTPVIHNIVAQIGTYRATFSTAKGESKTVKVYVVDTGYELVDGVLLFAQNFMLYKSEVEGKTVTNDLLIERAVARGYDLTPPQKVVAVTVKDRTELDHALTAVPITFGTYPVTFGYLSAAISSDVTVTDGDTLNITFDVNFKDINNENSLEILKGVTGKPYGTLPVPTRTGAEFLYWSLEVDGLTPINNATIIGSLQGTEIHHTLYAIWKYSVALDLQGGEEQGATIFVQQYRPYQYFQQLPVPQRRGYRFFGWAKDPKGTTMIDGETLVEKNIEHTLYALWEAREITVIFDPDGGAVSQDRKTVIFDAQYGQLPIAEKGYYKFKGWYMRDGRHIVDTTMVDTVAVEIILYAQYQSYSKANNDRYVITANNDGLNDRFYLQFLWANTQAITEVQVYIYDRLGNMVYNKNNYQETDGAFDGGKLASGTYIIAVYYLENGEKQVYNATITIIR